jgi:acetyl-CoA carboxylase biotin carboxyl carrier protein
MPQSGFDTKLVKDLAKILRDTDLTEIEVEIEGAKVRVARQASATHFVQAPMQGNPAPAAMSVPAPPAAPSTGAVLPVAANNAAPATEDLSKHAGVVPSPMVGTVYTQPEPGASAFIKVGDTVKEGQQLFIIEAMKTMNPVASTRSGVVKAILVHDAQPVEFGEALCVIE